MCDNCFNKEIKTFHDQNSWNLFDLELTQRLGNGKMKEIQFVKDMFRDKDDGFYIYQCNACGQEWKMKDYYDDSEYGGYFLKVTPMDRVDSFWNKIPTVLKLVITVVVLTILSVIYFLLNN